MASALPLDSLPALERCLRFLLSEPERCRVWAGRLFFPDSGVWFSRPDRAASLRALGLMVTAGLAGCRASEVLGLRRRDLAAPNIRVRSLKGGRPRVVPMPDPWFAALAVLLAGRDRRPAARRFLGGVSGRPLSRQRLWQISGPLFAAVGCPFACFHSLRHTAALLCYRETRDVFVVQRLLGHRNLIHTAEYLRQLEPVPWSGGPLSRPPELRVFRGDLPPESASAG